MYDLDVVIIGAGPAGLLAADRFLGSSAFDARVTILEALRQSGGIPRLYPTVAPNSPFNDLYSFLMDLRAEGALSSSANQIASEILQKARNAPSLAEIANTFSLLNEDLLSQDGNFGIFYETTVKTIYQQDNGSFELEYNNPYGASNRYTADVVVCAQGGIPRKNPYSKIFGLEYTIGDALNSGSCLFRDKKVVILGASHSGAIALINAVQQGAQKVEVWYKTDPFKEHHVTSEGVKYYQFSGINEPTLGRLKEALQSAGERVVFRSIDSLALGGVFPTRVYKDWCVVPAIGFERSPIYFSARGSKKRELTAVLQGEKFGDCAPNLCYPGTKDAIPGLYGLGLAYPLIFTPGFLPNTVESEKAAIVGIYFSYELSKLLVPDVLQNLASRLSVSEET